MSEINVKSFFKKYSIDTSSVHLAIRDVGAVIDNARDPAVMSNKLIAELGGKAVHNPIDAGIVARCLVERAFYAPKEYNPAIAYQYGIDKVALLKQKMPYIYSSSLNTKSSPKDTTAKSSDKKQQALALFTDNIGLKNAEISRILVKEMGMTLANANYYVAQFRKKTK